MPPPKTPLLAVDCVVLDRASRVLLIRRRYPPFQGWLALPGGFVEIGETVEAACRRELLEETGIKVGSLRLVGVYSHPARDPRGHACSVVFLARVRSANLVAGDDAASAEWIGNWRREKLAFDHREIISDAMRLASDRGPSQRSTRGR
jgi:8-oxo-dGTP diphosphatase